MTDERNRDWAAIHDPATTADQLTVIGQRYPEFLPAIVERLSAPPTIFAADPSATVALGAAAEYSAAQLPVQRPRRATAAWIIAAVTMASWAIPLTMMWERGPATWTIALSVVVTTTTAITVLVAGLVSGRGAGRKVAAAAASFAVFWTPVIAGGIVLALGMHGWGYASLYYGMSIAALAALTAWLVVAPRRGVAYWSLAVCVVAMAAVDLTLWFVTWDSSWVAVVFALQFAALFVVPLVCALTLGRRPPVAA